MNNRSAPPPLKSVPQTDDSSAPRFQPGLVVSLVGLLIFSIGAKPALFGWDRSPVVGFVQIAVFLVGLAIICLGGYVGVLSLWNGHERTIISDLGTRLAATGFVICVFAGMADVFGMGSQPYPQIPYFGPLQAAGVLIGEVVIVIGFLMFLPYRLLLRK